VKYQLLDRDGQQVLVGRMKIPTPGNGHAFILRRFDTNAISLTTMYRAAFPGASEQDERRETAWVKENHELLGNNGSTKEPHIIRLAGTWVDPDLAVQFADTYALGDIIALMAKAEPDPKAAYRKSSKAATPKGKDAISSMGLPTPSPTLATPSAPKRRKESSLPPTVAKAASPPPRRSTRVRSPPPASMPPSFASLASPKQSAKKTRRGGASSTGGSDETVVEDDAEIAAMAGPDMSQDVAEQQELIKNLQAQRASAMSAGDEDAKSKRSREEEEGPLQFEFKEPEVGERAIVTNKRVWMEPRTKSVAWGVAAFAIGMGAVSFLPNFL